MFFFAYDLSPSRAIEIEEWSGLLMPSFVIVALHLLRLNYTTCISFFHSYHGQCIASTKHIFCRKEQLLPIRAEEKYFWSPKHALKHLAAANVFNCRNEVRGI